MIYAPSANRMAPTLPDLGYHLFSSGVAYDVNRGGIEPCFHMGYVVFLNHLHTGSTFYIPEVAT
ncbi:hypothetical protein AciPR4_1524 [Terriglobus saanensis SP1PR4]|uniref:Uncharacterized protein n=1 Tax=Terriglobus saanensis (strain ATCC BAA-1853 / DSM 23119 / SP1PR4) TaxID=401053 RepID=E8V1R5_TERSS|nr:hypothetical protein AciPR4_1524 [Terriglobus saanensis SP1PR4]